MEEEIRKFEVSNRLFIIFSILLFIIISFLVFQSFIDFNNLPENYPREITISAQGKTFVKPDIAVVNLGVITEGMKIKDITKENMEKMNAVLTEVKNLGIEEKDIQTTKYDLSPRYEYLEKGERVFKGYTITQSARVKIRNFEKIGDVLDKASEKGANSISDLQFTIEEPEKVSEVARKEAIEKAKAKAVQVASQSGLKLVKLINVYENYSPIAAQYKEMGLGGGEIAAAPTIQPGEEEVTVTVYLVYRVR